MSLNVAWDDIGCMVLIPLFKFNLGVMTWHKFKLTSPPSPYLQEIQVQIIVHTTLQYPSVTQSGSYMGPENHEPAYHWQCKECVSPIEFTCSFARVCSSSGVVAAVCLPDVQVPAAV